jgi:uncharacterized membrane protein
MLRMRSRLIIFFGIVCMLPLIGEAATAPRTFRELASLIVDLLGAGVATLLALAIVIYLYGVATNMTRLSGEQDHSAWKTFVLWGIFILFVMVSIWGILNMLRNTFFENESAPPGVLAREMSRQQSFYVS